MPYAAVLDTESNLALQVDEGSWATLTNLFEDADFNCSSFLCVSQSNCSDLYANMSYIKVVIDDTAYWIPPAGYTYRKQNLTNDTCMVAITPGSQNNTILLGNYFLASYYAQLDYSSTQVSFGVNNRGAWVAGIGNASDLTPSNAYQHDLQNDNNSWTGSFFIGTPTQK